MWRIGVEEGVPWEKGISISQRRVYAMPEFNITIKMTGDAKQTVGVTSDMTVLQLKEKIATELDVAVERQRLIFSGKVLKDNDALSTYNIKEGHSIHLVKSAVKKESANTGSSSPSNAIPAAPTNIEAGQNAMDPLAGLTDARYAGYNIPMPTMDQLGFGTDGMALPAEEQLTQMMDNPLFQESMRSMLSNPQMLDYMIQQSPQLRAMGPAAREMLQSDYVRNMLTNPQAMKSMMEFQRAMGGNASSLGGGGPFGGFPTPGDAGASTATGSTAPANEPSNTESISGTTPNPTANPFASLFGANAGAAGGFGGMGGMGANPFMNPALMNMFGGNAAPASATPTDTRPPEEVYATQLRQLNDMGFFDFDRNITALRRSGGSVEGAIEMLFNGSV